MEINEWKIIMKTIPNDGLSDYKRYLFGPQLLTAPPRVPFPSFSRRCAKQAVVKIDFSGPFTSARFQLRYDRPRMWTLDISDSPFGDGYGGDNGTTSNMAEVHVYNKQLRIYGNNLPGHLDHAIDGGLLLKVVDNFVKKGQDAAVEVSDERVDWTQRGKKSHIESKFLFTLSGQNTTYGNTEYSVYAAFNRVIAGKYREGSGLCRVVITLVKGRGKPILFHYFDSEQWSGDEACGVFFNLELGRLVCFTLCG